MNSCSHASAHTLDDMFSEGIEISELSQDEQFDIIENHSSSNGSAQEHLPMQWETIDVQFAIFGTSTEQLQLLLHESYSRKSKAMKQSSNCIIYFR